ncbi:L-aspartate oxidase [Blastopirellula retiformator]|uniref:L-aspartate oxidase n=1 Tax=Blastopirellula retiformator TaxID=2527970 RepID=A0A5C5UZN1_9BACT|nr:L-aspartate oxidase [Blastopirellula retiformator]TWT31824.1 L-aspartate oxidase [Blastopirellula retiformator]
MTTTTPRYLVPFHPKRVSHYFTDVLVLGGGIAGLRAALEVDPSLSVLIVTKDKVLESNSTYAQGGIAGVLDDEDRYEDHAADTITAGGSLCDPAVVDMVVREGPACIRELIEWGTAFDEEDGQLALGREGGHGRSRIVHALGDSTGREVIRAVVERARSRENIQIWQNEFTLDLITHEGECRGALASDQKHGRTLIWAKQTILATGGVGQIYRESTNPKVATGDGLALAIRAGAQLRDMEFMQFHPTVLYIAGSGRSLITEAIRGEGAYLVDRSGNRFMADYDLRGELAPRDVVSQAIVSQMERTKSPCVFLSLSHLDAGFVQKRFPGIAQACAKFGIDITKDRVPVRPGAHYMIGGLTVDVDGRTTLPGLWAAGEVTSSGLHGANRLASNSLLEGLVYGKRSGRGASNRALEMPDRFTALNLENPRLPLSEPLDLEDIRNSLTSLMWRSAGVRRDETGLAEAVEMIDLWSGYVSLHQFDHPAGWELQNMLVVARAIAQSALARRESRGVHLRMDYPQTDDVHWNRHLAYPIT